MNKEAIRALYEENEVHQAIFEHLAARVHNRSETSIQRIEHAIAEEGYEASHAQVVRFFKSLEELECGRYIIGRHGWKSRFEWSVNLTELGRLAVGETDEISGEAIDAAESEEDEADFIDHVFVLRPGVSIQISLPQDFSTDEARRLSQFVVALPFE